MHRLKNLLGKHLLKYLIFVWTNLFISNFFLYHQKYLKLVSCNFKKDISYLRSKFLVEDRNKGKFIKKIIMTSSPPKRSSDDTSVASNYTARKTSFGRIRKIRGTFQGASCPCGRTFPCSCWKHHGTVCTRIYRLKVLLKFGLNLFNEVFQN